MQNLLFDLLKFKTTADNPNQLYQIIDYMDSYFNDFDVQKRRFENNNKPSLVITSKFTKSPRIFLVGHLDVVPAANKDFEPYEKDGKVYARGASDMKGNTAALIKVFSELVSEENQNYDIGLMLTTDEEIGGFDGVKYLLKDEEFRSEIAFIPDVCGRPWQICSDEKGVIHINVTAKGKAAHGAWLWEGDNAVNRCWKTYRDIRNDFREKWGKLREEDSWKPTINLGSLHGGDAANKVPDFSEMKIDIRFPSPHTLDEIKEIIDKYAKANGVSYEIKVTGHPTHTDSNNEYVKQWNSVLKSLNKKAVFFKTNGGSDARHFAEFNIPALMTAPTSSGAHIQDEWVDLKDLELFKVAIKSWIKNIHN